MTFDELLKKVLEILPNAEVEVASWGELIINTNMMIKRGSDKVVDWKEENDGLFDHLNKEK
jgi:hypothetical protein